MNEKLLPFMGERAALISSGVGEVCLGIAYLACWRCRALNWPGLVFAPLATVAVLIALPGLFTHAFNPFSINLALFALCWINYTTTPTD